MLENGEPAEGVHDHPQALPQQTTLATASLSQQPKTQHQHKTGHAHTPQHEHAHDDSAHSHEHAGQSHEHSHGRSLSVIRSLIKQASLPAGVKEGAINRKLRMNNVFLRHIAERLAEVIEVPVEILAVGQHLAARRAPAAVEAIHQGAFA